MALNNAALLGFSVAGLTALIGLWLLFTGGRLWLHQRQQPAFPPLTGETPRPSGKGQTRVLGRPTCHRCGNQLKSESQNFCNVCGANRVIGDRYKIIQAIGQGGMGAVYLVDDLRLRGKQWAVKSISDAGITSQLDRDLAIDAFQREAELLARLEHPNLPNVMDFVSQGEQHYLVMDFIEGKTLKELLAERPGPFAEIKVVEWASQVCDVLHYLHNQNPPVIFRDLKPANIMITRANQVKLIDFGIARLFKPGQKGDTLRLGTPGYAAPEQYSRNQSDARSDIYALGVTIHEMLTKYDPTDTPFNLPPVEKLNPMVSTNLVEIIEKATQTELSRRFQTIEEMKQVCLRNNH